MAFLDYFSILSSIPSGLGSLPIWGIISGSLGLLLIIFLIWYGISNKNLSSGTHSEKRSFKDLGFTTLGIGSLTGWGLYKLLRWGGRGSIKLGKLALKAGKNTVPLVRDAAKYVQKLTKGEELDIEEVIHQTSAVASSNELATIIGKLGNSELNEDASKAWLDLKIQRLDSQLSKLSNIENIDDQARNFVIEICHQVTSALIELANSEKLEVDVRKRAFKEVYRIVKVIKTAETLAKRIESKAISNQGSLSKFNHKEIIDLEKYLSNKI